MQATIARCRRIGPCLCCVRYKVEPLRRTSPVGGKCCSIGFRLFAHSRSSAEARACAAKQLEISDRGVSAMQLRQLSMKNERHLSAIIGRRRAARTTKPAPLRCDDIEGRVE